jgi:hypothetical protein
MKYSMDELRTRIAREEGRAAGKIKKIAAGTYNPRGKRSRLYDITQANKVANGEIPMPSEGLPAAYYRGVDITGTERDPRRDSHRLRRPGLERYLEDLRTFNSGLVNYFKAADGSVVTGQEIRASRRITGYETDPVRIGRRRQTRPVIEMNPVTNPLTQALEANSGVRIPWLGGSELGTIRAARSGELFGFRRSNESVRPLTSAELRMHILGRDPDAPSLRAAQQKIVRDLYTLPTNVREALFAMDPGKFMIAFEAGGEFTDALYDLYRECNGNVEEEDLNASIQRLTDVISQANELKIA